MLIKYNDNVKMKNTVLDKKGTSFRATTACSVAKLASVA